MGTEVFISYRRDGGEVMAHLVYEHLRNLGYSVFYDIESMTTGQFDETLLSRIAEADNFVLILSKNALDRCVYETDWVRREIAHALKLHKNVIPVMLRGFAFPMELPDDIKAVSLQHGVVIDSMDFLEAKIEKLTSYFKGKPSNAPRRVKETSQPYYISNVCSIGTKNPSETWPRGVFTPDINLDECTTVRFAVSLLHPFGKDGNVPTVLRIYDEGTGNLVFEDEGSIYFHAADDRYSTGWVVRGNDGSYQHPGEYRAEFSVNGSRPFVYRFRLYSQRTGAFARPVPPPYGGAPVNTPLWDAKTAARIRSIQDNLTRPKGLLWATFWFVGFLMFFINVADLAIYENDPTFFNIMGTFFIGPALMLYGFIMLCQYCKKFVWNSGGGTFLLVGLLTHYFCVFLLISAIRTWIKRPEWMRELNNYGAPAKR